MTAPHLHSDPFLSLKWRRAFGRFERKLHLWLAAAIKGGFDPNQPRVPAGNPSGGQWTDGGGQILSDANPDNFWKPGAQLAQAKKPKESGKLKKPGEPPKLKLPLPVKSKRSGRPLGPAPEIPRIPPPTSRQRTGLLNGIVRFIGGAARARNRILLELFHEALRETPWLHDKFPILQSGLEGPKSLDELREAVLRPKPGYDIHHIVEQTPARKAEFPEHMINGAENLVRIGGLRHWEINAWYSRPNERFVIDGKPVSPRDYLRDKSWDERMQVGLDAMRKHKVLKK